MHSSILNHSQQMKQNNIYPECNVDTNLVGFVIGGYAKHKSCCNEVVKAVNHSDEFAIGIIDDDKRRATMDDGFDEYKQSDEVANKHLKLFIHKDGKRYMFAVKPEMDDFIFDIANDMGVDISSFGFGKNIDEFKKDTKRVQAATDPKLRKLFFAISDHPEIQRFRNTLRYLMLKQYRADASVVRGFFDGRLGSQDLQGFFDNQ